MKFTAELIEQFVKIIILVDYLKTFFLSSFRSMHVVSLLNTVLRSREIHDLKQCKM